MISGIILAAGASARMGSPKALLEINGSTFLQHIIGVLKFSQVENITIVVGAHEKKIEESLTGFTGNIVINSNWQEGQLSSLIAGLETLKDMKDVDGVLVCPVDHPLISQSIVVDLLMGYWTKQKNIIIPTHQGKRGHPVIFGKKMFDSLLSVPSDKGANYVVHQYPDDVLEVPVNDSGVVTNIDTPEDYLQYIARHSS